MRPDVAMIHRTQGVVFVVRVVELRENTWQIASCCSRFETATEKAKSNEASPNEWWH